MFRIRLISGLVVVALVIGMLSLASPGVIRLFLTLLVGIASWEMATMILPRLHQKLGNEASPYPLWIITLACLMNSLLYYWILSSEEQQFQVLVTGFVLYLVIGIFSSREPDLSFGFAAGLVTVLAYGVLPWVAIWSLYQRAEDARYIYFLAAIVSSGDTAAYFAGKSFGKQKLSPHFSPNKTVEGSLGGFLGSFLGGTIVKLIIGSDFLEWWVVGLACLLVGALGQMGDLAESAIKRFSCVKDSGSIMPGHGGLLDRMDGILIAAPGLWLILSWVQ